jgi:hypothetical protein
VVRLPHGGARPLYQMSTCLAQLVVAPHAVQIRSRNTLDMRGEETLVLHRVRRARREARRLLDHSSPGVKLFKKDKKIGGKGSISAPRLTQPRRVCTGEVTEPGRVCTRKGNIQSTAVQCNTRVGQPSCVERTLRSTVCTSTRTRPLQREAACT